MLGALKSSPIPALGYDSNLPDPIVRLDRAIFRSALRLLTLPNSNPAGARARDCRDSFPRSFPSTLHKIFHRSSISFPPDLEVLLPLPLPPSFLPNFSTLIPDSKEAALDAYKVVANNRTDLHIFTDSSLTEDGLAAAALEVESGWDSVIRIGDSNRNSVFEGELTGIRIALGRIAQFDEDIPPNVIIFSDSQSAIKAREGHTKNHPGQHIQLDIHSRFRTISNLMPEVRFRLQWIPGHLEIEGNELVDNLAKGATKRND
ncbi:hypothetical protein BT69DRAFT_1229741, partial [Atractiella rhizophila]